VALASGLSAGDQVITDGALYLEADEPIEIVTDTDPSAERG